MRKLHQLMRDVDRQARRAKPEKLADDAARLLIRPVRDVRDPSRELDGELARQDDAAVHRPVREEDAAGVAPELGCDLLRGLRKEDRLACER